MSHMVIYRGSDGKPGYHQVDDIHDAVSFVEEMRNTEGVDHARIFRLEEVSFEFKPYYRVEIGGVPAADLPSDGSSGGDQADSVVEIGAGDSDSDDNESDNGQSDDEEMADVDDDDDDSDSGDDDDEDAAGGGARRGLFGR